MSYRWARFVRATTAVTLAATCSISLHLLVAPAQLASADWMEVPCPPGGSDAGLDCVGGSGGTSGGGTEDEPWSDGNYDTADPGEDEQFGGKPSPGDLDDPDPKTPSGSSGSNSGNTGVGVNLGVVKLPSSVVSGGQTASKPTIKFPKPIWLPNPPSDQNDPLDPGTPVGPGPVGQPSSEKGPGGSVGQHPQDSNLPTPLKTEKSSTFKRVKKVGTKKMVKKSKSQRRRCGNKTSKTKSRKRCVRRSQSKKLKKRSSRIQSRRK